MNYTSNTIGVPRTVGQLREMLEPYHDDTEFGFRNGPLERLVACTYEGVPAVLFDSREPTVNYERCVELEAYARELENGKSEAYSMIDELEAEANCWRAKCRDKGLSEREAKERADKAEARVKLLKGLVLDLEPSVFNDECLYCASGTTEQWMSRRDEALRGETSEEK